MSCTYLILCLFKQSSPYRTFFIYVCIYIVSISNCTLVQNTSGLQVRVNFGQIFVITYAYYEMQSSSLRLIVIIAFCLVHYKKRTVFLFWPCIHNSKRRTNSLLKIVSLLTGFDNLYNICEAKHFMISYSNARTSYYISEHNEKILPKGRGSISNTPRENRSAFEGGKILNVNTPTIRRPLKMYRQKDYESMLVDGMALSLDINRDYCFKSLPFHDRIGFAVYS